VQVIFCLTEKRYSGILAKSPEKQQTCGKIRGIFVFSCKFCFFVVKEFDGFEG
jgi:hypothetical protein